MSLFNKNWFGSVKSSIQPMPELWGIDLVSTIYIEIQLRSIFKRIISEVLTRSHEINDSFRPLLLNSMEGFGSPGLIEHIVDSMAKQRHLVLKYEAGILFEPKHGERQTIMDGWKEGIKPPRTLMLSFQGYEKTTLLRQYLLHKFLLLCTQHKMLNLSTALQLKMNDLRQSVALNDAEKAVEQAKKVVEALLGGQPVLIDAQDSLELATPDVGPIKEVSDDIHNEISLILGLPLAWVTGVGKAGLGDSGDADARAIERGLEPYFWESVYPAFMALFGTKLKFKSHDYDNLTSALETIRTFELTSDSLLTHEAKLNIVNRLLGLSLEENNPEPEPKPESLDDNRLPERDGEEASAEETDQSPGQDRPNSQ